MRNRLSLFAAQFAAVALVSGAAYCAPATAGHFTAIKFPADKPDVNAPPPVAPPMLPPPPDTAEPLPAPPSDDHPKPQFLLVDKKNVDALTALDGGVHAVSLGVTRAALDKKTDARDALIAWVNKGGTVFLHTDAAQLFGYKTTAPRQATAAVAGQYWGRARSAAAFGAHPLLMGAVTRGTADTAARSVVSAVRVVYYQLGDDDQLVVSHPAAVPLLRVTDLAAAGGRTLYAAAAAPCGRGWAIFTPGFVEQDRADGGLFVVNLMKWADVVRQGSGSSKTDAKPGQVPAPAESPISLPEKLINAAAEAAQGGDFDAGKVAVDFATATAIPVAAPTDDGKPAAYKAVPGLPLDVREYTATVHLLGTVDADDKDNVNKAKAVLFVLRAREARQDGDLAEADTWLKRATDTFGESAEADELAGLQSAEASEDHTLPSPQRALLLANAVTSWSAVGAAPRLVVPDTTKSDAANGAAKKPTANVAKKTIAGVPQELLAGWLNAADYAARLFAVEPPLVTQIGTAQSGIVVRHYADDPSLRLALPAAQALLASSATTGMYPDEEEVLFFPTQQHYVAYRVAAGLQQQNAPAPGGFVGDAIDGRMILLSQQTQIMLLPAAIPGGAPRPVTTGNLLPRVMGRLHAQILLNQLSGGSTGAAAPVRGWVRLGFAAYYSRIMAAAMGEVTDPNDAVELAAKVGNMVFPTQYEAEAQGNNGLGLDMVTDGQAARLILYFETRFGKGSFTELLQRTGGGEGFASALNATTGLSEEDFFKARYAADRP